MPRARKRGGRKRKGANPKVAGDEQEQREDGAGGTHSPPRDLQEPHLASLASLNQLIDSVAQAPDGHWGGSDDAVGEDSAPVERVPGLAPALNTSRIVETVRQMQTQHGEGAARFLAGVENMDLSSLCDIPGFNPLLLLLLRVQECFDRATGFFLEGHAESAVEWFSGSASEAVSAQSVASIHVVEYCSNINAAVAQVLAGNSSGARRRAERALAVLRWESEDSVQPTPQPTGPDLPSPVNNAPDSDGWYLQRISVEWLRQHSTARALVVRGLSHCLDACFDQGLADFETAITKDAENSLLRGQVEQLVQLVTNYRQASKQLQAEGENFSLHAHLLSTNLLPRFLESLLERIPATLLERGKAQQAMLLGYQQHRMETQGTTDLQGQTEGPDIITGTSMSAAAAVSSSPNRASSSDALPDYPVEFEGAESANEDDWVPKVNITPPERKEGDLPPLLPIGDVFDSDDEIHDLPQMAMVEPGDEAASQTFEYARTSKERGNDCFERGDFETALLHYGEALKLHSTDAPATAVFLSNRSLCHLKLQNYADAIIDASVAIQLRPSIKPLARRATAFAELRQWSLAVIDYKSALRFEPKNIECLRELKKCLVQVSAECSAQLEACKQHLKDQQEQWNSQRDYGEIKKLQVQIADVQRQLEEVRDDLATVAKMAQ